MMLKNLENLRSGMLKILQNPKDIHEHQSKKSHHFEKNVKVSRPHNILVKVDTFDGREGVPKATAFIREFEVAYANCNFSEASKVRHVTKTPQGELQVLGDTPKLCKELTTRLGFNSRLNFVTNFFFPPLHLEIGIREDWDRFCPIGVRASYTIPDMYQFTLSKVAPLLNPL
ncbi:hypothetical protein L7F22_055680 [Adiantum nelumboides]|nr:hypothetical protein [Adiantum nelumboides]